MPTINDLRRQRADISTRVQALAALATLSSEQQAEYTSLVSQFSDLGAQIQRMEQAEQMAAAAAVAPVSPMAPATAPPVAAPMPASPRNHAREVRVQKMIVGGYLNALFRAASDGGSPLVIARGLPFNETVKAGVVQALEAKMALNTETASAGGNLVPTLLSPQIIDYLYPSAILRNIGQGVTPIMMPNGNLDLGKLSSPPVMSYTGRNAAVGVTSATIGKSSMKAKKMTGLVPIARDLMRFAGINEGVDELVMRSLSRAAGVSEDIAFIRGDGTGTNIKGLRYWAPSSTNVLNATAIGSLSASTGALQQAIVGDLGRLESALLRSNVQIINGAWLMHPDSRVYMTNLRTTTGAPVFPGMQEPKLVVGPDGVTRSFYFHRGLPIGETTQIPTNLTSGGATSNGSEIYLVELSYWCRGDAVPAELSISNEASYTDPTTSNMVNAFERDETLIRLIVENDFAPFQAVAVAVLDGVTWGR